MTRSQLRSAIVLGLALSILGACKTEDIPVETPQGRRSSDQLTGFEILGVLSRRTSTLHRPDAKTLFEEDVKVNVPPGTTLIVPSIHGWATGYGKTVPEDLTSGSSFHWNPADHNFGIQYIYVWVSDIDAVDNSTTPSTQTATIHITMWLSDDNLDDEWWGVLEYTLLCLGPKPVS